MREPISGGDFLGESGEDGVRSAVILTLTRQGKDEAPHGRLRSTYHGHIAAR
jgi:hypothetical protein